jgi:hypothetical protein
MPTRFPFEFETLGDLDVVRWIGDPRLPGWERRDLWGDGRSAGQHGLFGAAGLLYPALLGVIWRLTVDQARFVLPVFDGVLLCERNQRPYSLVSWQYEILWEANEWAQRDQGFAPAESLRNVASTRGFDQRFPRAALAQVRSWSELMSLIPFGDQANTVCLFGIGPASGAREQLLQILRGDAPPRLTDVVVSPTDLFAVITQEDEDLGLSSLLVAGRPGLHERFEGEAESLERRIDEYLPATAAAADQRDWLAAVDSCAAVPF